MLVVRFTVTYDGTDFAGSQVQPRERTVQGELEQTLAEITGSAVRTAFAGRTDRGVHAAGQVVSAIVEWRHGIDALQRALNGELPDDVAVVDIDETDDEFHARFDARWREYRYAIVEAPVRPVLERRYTWWLRDRLDEKSASEGASFFAGRHRFGSFAGAGLSQREPAEKLERLVHVCDWHMHELKMPGTGGARRRHIVRVVANGFLPNMVRNMVAALVEVARGHREPEWVQSVVGANDRRELDCAPAPPEGLILWRVGYREYDSSRVGALGVTAQSTGQWCGAFECQCA